MADLLDPTVIIPGLTAEGHEQGIGFFGWHKAGAVQITPSDHPGFWHCSVFELSSQTALETKRPMAPELISHMINEWLPEAKITWQPRECKRRCSRNVRLAEPRHSIVKPKEADTQECIYFIQATTSKLIKIGHTLNLKSRLASLRCGSPDRLTVLYTISGAHSDEAVLHRRFVADRRHGEWFEPSESLLAFIEESKAR